MTIHDELRRLSEAEQRTFSEDEPYAEYRKAKDDFHQRVDGSIVIALLDEIKELKEADKSKHQAYTAREWENCQLRDEIEKLKQAALVPGHMHCAKCNFTLHRRNLNMRSGTVTAGDNSPETCPNGCGPLWPVTWEQEANSAYEAANNIFDKSQVEIAQLRAELEQAKKDAARYKWIRHRTSAHGRIDGYQFAFPTWMSLPAPVEAMYEVAPALDSAIDAVLSTEEKKS